MSIYKEKLLDRIEGSSIPTIPFPLQRISTVFNIVQGRYTLVGSLSGTGKTSFVDDNFILKPFTWLEKTKSDIHYEGLYFSMERTIDFKLAKFASWKLYHDKGIRIPSGIILGTDYDHNGNKRELSSDHRKYITNYQDWFDNLLELVNIKDGIKTVAEIKSDIELLRKKLGRLFYSDSTDIYENGKKIGSFGNSFKETKRGKVPIFTIAYKGIIYELQQNDKLYILHNPNTIVFIVVDHVGKIKTTGYSSKKLAIDALDEVLSDARDIYHFSPIPISQFNRSLSDINRIKLFRGDLSPIYDDFKDTGNTVESADLVISPFDPYKAKSYDEDGNFKGYNLKKGMLSPSGAQRFRSLHILKNSYGIADVTFGLKFIGESMYYTTLPRPDDTQKLNEVYNEIMKGN